MDNAIERAQMLNEELNMLTERANFVDEQISELAVFGNDLNVLKNSKSPEILASVGKGLYVKSTMIEKNFFVNVGAGIFVQKSVDEAKLIVNEQISKLSKMRDRISSRLIPAMAELQTLKIALEKGI